MTETHYTKKEDTLKLQDQVGDLAESARRHLAYVALAEQIATSENALQQVLEALGRVGRIEKDAPQPPPH
jgi:hypothetical protein